MTEVQLLANKLNKTPSATEYGLFESDILCADYVYHMLLLGVFCFNNGNQLTSTGAAYRFCDAEAWQLFDKHVDKLSTFVVALKPLVAKYAEDAAQRLKLAKTAESRVLALRMVIRSRQSASVVKSSLLRDYIEQQRDLGHKIASDGCETARSTTLARILPTACCPVQSSRAWFRRQRLCQTRSKQPLQTQLREFPCSKS